MTDLYELAKEYCDYLERVEDPDQDWPLDEGEQEEFEALKALNDELNDDLNYPGNITSWIPEGEWVQYVQSSCEGMYGTVPTYLENYIDWKSMAEDWEEDYEKVEWDGDTYYVQHIS